MLQVLNPSYTIKIEIKDAFQNQSQGGATAAAHSWGASGPVSPYRWYDSATGKTGCDEVLAAVKDALSKAGLPASYVTLERFEHR